MKDEENNVSVICAETLNMVNPRRKDPVLVRPGENRVKRLEYAGNLHFSLPNKIPDQFNLLPDDKILVFSKSKDFTDDNFNAVSKGAIFL